MTKVTFLGTGTSQGVPIIACDCPVCTSRDSKDKRLRSSILVEHKGYTILVDAGPDFRFQMLRAEVKHLDAIILTHNHKDHTGGLDDVRAFNHIEGKASEIYCEEYVEESLRREYSYAFAKDKYPGVPQWNIHKIGGKPSPDPFIIKSEDKKNSIEIIPIRGIHASLPVLGYRFGNIAYCTDMNFIPDDEFKKLENLEHFIISTVKRGKHNSHWGLEEALEVAKKINAKSTWLTHISHALPKFYELEKELAALDFGPVHIAYDGMIIEA